MTFQDGLGGPGLGPAPAFLTPVAPVGDGSKETPKVVVDPPATSSAVVDPKPSFEDIASGAVTELRKWQSSLTMQGGILGGAATFVAAKGAPLLLALGVSSTIASEAVGDLAGVLGAIGVFMVFIGRLRLGDLK